MKKTVSIDFVEKDFNSKEKDQWNGTVGMELLFFELYIKKMYADIIHDRPFTDIYMNEETKKDNKKEYTFGITDWNINTRLFYGKDNLDEYYKNFKNTYKRFTIYKVGYDRQNRITHEDISHSIVFIYDKFNNELELFDSTDTPLKGFKKNIKNFFQNIYGNSLTFYYPDFKKYYPFGDLYEYRCNDGDFIFTSDGFCVVWSLWYIELRIKNKDIPRAKIHDKLIKYFYSNRTRICRLIIGYAQFIQKIIKDYRMYYDEKLNKHILEKIKTRTRYTIPTVLVTALGIAGAILFGIKQLNKKN